MVPNFSNVERSALSDRVHRTKSLYHTEVGRIRIQKEKKNTREEKIRSKISVVRNIQTIKGGEVRWAGITRNQMSILHRTPPYHWPKVHVQDNQVNWM